MIYVYFDGDQDAALLEFLRDNGEQACSVLTPKLPTRASIDEHKRQAPHGGVVFVVKRDDGTSRLVAEW